MPYSEAKEHAPCRLHRLFTSPYTAFDNQANERQLHLLLALQTLLFGPLEQGRLTLRLLDGWQNGDCQPHTLVYQDIDIRRPEDLATASPAMPWRPLLSTTLEESLSQALEDDVALPDDIRHTPARWPAFAGGLSLYTRYKVCHRLIYGEDDSYRSIRCETPAGLREIHEFHLQEGDFAISLPHADAKDGSDDTVGLVAHGSQRQLLARWLIELAEKPLLSLLS
ncbi:MULTISPECIES: hypothetical protein [unclassified Halomonas]|uniref:hypothetical protein n=3 Tax=Halomonadaceae TaxID=28256 RepID=UPI001C963FEB|nr:MULTISPECIES: hypothetical protein [unclassified Halomonas]MBY5923833.1 hypothetical protein [Halomonas sp. DP4Y7-2]MBY5982970.1 hypothetical protein [Halomonas sp. DP5Y7-2]MBY6230875.1 hypothetical protein [Halomonas sp. DP4Y7-1]MED5296935.1 hypothetical protein [Pseudomonadota bacterium]